MTKFNDTEFSARAAASMRIVVGLDLGGETLSDYNDLAPGHGTIGAAVWGPHQLLRDLELRSGLGTDTEPEALRTARWAERLARLAPLGRFYSRSYAVDPLGTARTVLQLRDSLIQAGWNGQAISGGGPRLDAIRELEDLSEPALPLGAADRLAAVARTLDGGRACLYRDVASAEAIELWPARWQAVFRALERAGTRMRRDTVTLPGAPPDTDLGRVQAALQIGGAAAPLALHGDGSFVALTAETSWEAARATAALLARAPAEHTVVVREHDVSALDNALSVHGLCTQGWRSLSPWRAALQILPLALELAFEPKDPYRVLELLTLPIGPFHGLPGHRLARALVQSPGIGSPAWETAKKELAALLRGPELLARIVDWLERDGSDSAAGAPKSDLLLVIERVRAWLLSRLPSTPEEPTLLAAAGHAAAMRAALESDPRSTLSLVEVRRLAESIVRPGTTVQLEPERAGRIEHVGAPAGLRVSRDTVVWWSFVDARDTRPTSPWRRQELTALSRAGVDFPDARARLAERASASRRALLAATRRLVLVVPRSSAGKPVAPHPLWDELAAHTAAGARARVVVNARDLLKVSPPGALLRSPPLDSFEAVPLPGGHPEWSVPEETLSPIEELSPASLNALLGCPLQWALRYRAGIRAGEHALPPLRSVNGTLGHRLVELLHADGAFEQLDAQLETCAEDHLDRLFQREGATLLRSGMGFERSQLRKQLVGAVLELSRTLRAARLRIVAVEKPIDVRWRNVRLVGRIDLLVAAENGEEAIIDVKWGLTSYRDRLRSGQASQLAAYAFARASERGDQAPLDAAYFSLKQSRLFGLPSRFWPDAEGVDGPSLSETWSKIERSVDEVERLTARGRFPATGLRRSVPLLTAFGAADAAKASYFSLEPNAACAYCSFDALCGRRWEIAQ